ncbi:MAG: hypothetical protein ACO1RA_08390 [Planctomycetaceae bacterium]
MSKLACHCGNIISDSTYPSATEGWIVRQQDQDALDELICQSIAAFIAAIKAGKRDEWIRRLFHDPYPLDLDDASVISDIIAFHKLGKQLSICECPQCGRLHVQKELGLNFYLGYMPIQEGYAAVLRSNSAPAS